MDTQLPTELIYDIAYTAASISTADALSLALASRCTHDAAMRALYHTVCLPSLHTVAAFCMEASRLRHLVHTRALALGYRQWLDVSLYHTLVHAAENTTALYCPLDVFLAPLHISSVPISLMLVAADNVDAWPPLHALPFGANLRHLYIESLPPDPAFWPPAATVGALRSLTHYAVRTSSDYTWTVDEMLDHLVPFLALPRLRVILIHSNFVLQSPFTNLGGWCDALAQLRDPRIHAAPAGMRIDVWARLHSVGGLEEWWETSGVQLWSGA